MRLAILSTQNNVIVEFDEKTFRALLISYTKKNAGDVVRALDQIEAELKALTITA